MNKKLISITRYNGTPRRYILEIMVSTDADNIIRKVHSDITWEHCEIIRKTYCDAAMIYNQPYPECTLVNEPYTQENLVG